MPAIEGASRFAIGVTPTGWPIAHGENIAHCYRFLLNARRAGMAKVAPPRVSIQLRAVVRQRDGSYLLGDRGEPFEAPIVAEPERPSKRSSVRRSPRTLDEAFLGEDGWAKAPDDVLWASALETAIRHRLEGVALRELNDVTALLILARAGATAVGADELPSTAKVRVGV